jgi:50S ribosomal subunit-associated GTPase HflX
MLSAPIPATQKALARSGLSVDDIGVFEVNEAFAPVPMAWLKELGADEKRTITVFNKADAADDEARQRAHRLDPNGLLVSARTGLGLEQLVDRCLELIADSLGASTLLIPHGRYDIVARFHEVGHVQHEEQRDEGVFIQGRFPPSQAGVFAPFVLAADDPRAAPQDAPV